jgi:formylglycine-generating enzyme required for sulfatase activity
MRGGSWDWSPKNCRSAYRQCDVPEKAYNNVGFRVAVDSK